LLDEKKKKGKACAFVHWGGGKEGRFFGSRPRFLKKPAVGVAYDREKLSRTDRVGLASEAKFEGDSEVGRKTVSKQEAGASLIEHSTVLDEVTKSIGVKKKNTRTAREKTPCPKAEPQPGEKKRNKDTRPSAGHAKFLPVRGRRKAKRTQGQKQGKGEIIFAHLTQGKGKRRCQLAFHALKRGCVPGIQGARTNRVSDVACLSEKEKSRRGTKSLEGASEQILTQSEKKKAAGQTCVPSNSGYLKA